MMDLKDRYLDRIADALEKQMGVSPKLIGGNVLKPNIYRIADALDPNPQLLAYGTVKNPLARIADAIEGGNFGGGSGEDSSQILTGIIDPNDSIGSDNNLYIKYSESYPNIKFIDYLGTNNSALNLELTNYIYNYSDRIVLNFIMNSANVIGNWACYLKANDKQGLSSVLHVQQNRYAYRQVINFSYNGSYSGDSNINVGHFLSMKGVLNTIDIDGNKIGFFDMGGYFSDNEYNTLGTKSEESSGYNLILFPVNGDSYMDANFVNMTVYRNNEIIHKYVPIEDGVFDLIDGSSFMLETNNHINGPIRDLDLPEAVYFKHDSAWIKYSIGNKWV